MANIPVIGITLDWQKEGGFSKSEHYALRTHYFDAITKAGGLAFGIAYDKAKIPEYIEICDGFLSPGGECASPIKWYVEEEQATGSPYDLSPRVEFELELLQAFLEADKPVLGICQGMQQLGGIYSCKMTGDVQAYLNTDIEHPLNGRNPEEYTHNVEIERNTQLYDIIKKDILPANTAHREAIVEVTDKVIVSARSTDGCIEAIEIKDKYFALGLQWHPEYLIYNSENGHFNIFKCFVDKAKRYKYSHLT